MRGSPAVASDPGEARAAAEVDCRATSADSPDLHEPAVDRTAGPRCVALAWLLTELDGHGSGPASGAMRRLEARVAAAVLGAAAFERPRAVAGSGDLFRVDPMEADLAELVRPGELNGMVGVRPVLRSLDAAVQLARDAGIETAWALRLSLSEGRQENRSGSPAAPAIATRLCRILVLWRLVEEVAGSAADPWLAPLEHGVLIALAASPEPVDAGELGQLVAGALARGGKSTVKAALWRLRHLGLVGRRAGSWQCTAAGHRLARRLDGARHCPADRSRRR